MWLFNLRGKNYEKKLNFFIDNYSDKLTEKQKNLINIRILKYKKYSEDEYYILLIFIYWLITFKIIDNNSDLLTNFDKENILKLENNYLYSINWEKEKYLDSILSMNDNLFILTTIIKYTLLDYYNYLNIIIPNECEKKNFHKSIWYIIPYLTLKESKLLWFFQDVYFKQIYQKKYIEVKQIYFEQISKIELPWEYLIWVIDDLSELMQKINVNWILRVRKKSYFSMFNKIERKKYKNVSDFIWVRIIFVTKRDLSVFVKKFEKNHIFINKKDYIKKPKINWYKSIHYKYLTSYMHSEILVELQIRTRKMDWKINNIKEMSHFNYTIKEKKWSNIFKEVHFWHNYMMDFFEKQKVN